MPKTTHDDRDTAIFYCVKKLGMTQVATGKMFGVSAGRARQIANHEERRRRYDPKQIAMIDEAIETLREQRDRFAKPIPEEDILRERKLLQERERLGWHVQWDRDHPARADDVHDEGG